MPVQTLPMHTGNVYSIGKDSSALLHLTHTAFHPGRSQSSCRRGSDQRDRGLAWRYSALLLAQIPTRDGIPLITDIAMEVAHLLDVEGLVEMPVSTQS
ncbi:MAG: hypothetical protein EXR05_10465 [Acetobacteraceae bacterium]|nr:hypothetical protein [Acetobacteraceae bacterium]